MPTTLYFIENWPSLFSLLEIRRSAITPSTALHAFAPVCTLRRTSLSPSSRLRTLPLPDTRNCLPESVSSPPARFQLFPLDAYLQHLRLLYVNFQPVSGKQPVPLLQCLL